MYSFLQPSHYSYRAHGFSHLFHPPAAQSPPSRPPSFPPPLFQFSLFQICVSPCGRLLVGLIFSPPFHEKTLPFSLFFPDSPPLLFLPECVDRMHFRLYFLCAGTTELCESLSQTQSHQWVACSHFVSSLAFPDGAPQIKFSFFFFLKKINPPTFKCLDLVLTVIPPPARQISEGSLSFYPLFVVVLHTFLPFSKFSF